MFCKIEYNDIIHLILAHLLKIIYITNNTSNIIMVQDCILLYAHES